jgi:hypothetical protein
MNICKECRWCSYDSFSKNCSLCRNEKAWVVYLSPDPVTGEPDIFKHCSNIRHYNVPCPHWEAKPPRVCVRWWQFWRTR